MQEADKTDPFNYPFPNRRDLMSLSTISIQYQNFNYIKKIFKDFRDVGFRKVKMRHFCNLLRKIINLRYRWFNLIKIIIQRCLAL